MKFDSIFSIQSDSEFESLCLEIFECQATNNQLYKDYLKYRNIKVSDINTLEKIPFLPIQFFKSHQLITHPQPTDHYTLFTSSGTTSSTTSTHYVKDIEVYKQSFKIGFSHFYGSINETVILALLPNYSERTGSSLIYMVDDLIQSTLQPESGYYLYNHEDLYTTLLQLAKQKKRTILIGVSFALLDWIEKYTINFPELIVLETGGMKGRKKEMIRTELHALLSKGFGTQKIHSEYGMTELLSQAYAQKNGLFSCPPWMKLLLRDTEDPTQLLREKGKTGAINVIDLANYNSISFIATDDLGKQITENQTEILGRFDQADVRGCNLLL